MLSQLNQLPDYVFFTIAVIGMIALTLGTASVVYTDLVEIWGHGFGDIQDSAMWTGVGCLVTSMVICVARFDHLFEDLGATTCFASIVYFIVLVIAYGIFSKLEIDRKVSRAFGLSRKRAAA